MLLGNDSKNSVLFAGAGWGGSLAGFRIHYQQSKPLLGPEMQSELLGVAVCAGRTELAELLLSDGANAHLRLRCGLTAFELAAVSEQKQLLQKFKSDQAGTHSDFNISIKTIPALFSNPDLKQKVQLKCRKFQEAIAPNPTQDVLYYSFLGFTAEVSTAQVLATLGVQTTGVLAGGESLLVHAINKGISVSSVKSLALLHSPDRILQNVKGRGSALSLALKSGQHDTSQALLSRIAKIDLTRNPEILSAFPSDNYAWGNLAAQLLRQVVAGHLKPGAQLLTISDSQKALGFLGELQRIIGQSETFCSQVNSRIASNSSALESPAQIKSSDLAQKYFVSTIISTLYAAYVCNNYNVKNLSNLNLNILSRTLSERAKIGQDWGQFYRQKIQGTENTINDLPDFVTEFGNTVIFPLAALDLNHRYGFTEQQVLLNEENLLQLSQAIARGILTNRKSLIDLVKLLNVWHRTDLAPSERSLKNPSRMKEWHNLVQPADKKAGDLSTLNPSWQIGDLEIVCLTRGSDLIQEGNVMSHCVAGYITRCLAAKSHIFSIRKDNQSIATVEVAGLDPDNKHHLSVTQKRGYKNSDMPSEANEAWQEFADMVSARKLKINNSAKHGETEESKARHIVSRYTSIAYVKFGEEPVNMLSYYLNLHFRFGDNQRHYLMSSGQSDSVSDRTAIEDRFRRQIAEILDLAHPQLLY